MRSYSADAVAIPANGSDSNYTVSVADLLDTVKDTWKWVKKQPNP